MSIGMGGKRRNIPKTRRANDHGSIHEWSYRGQRVEVRSLQLTTAVLRYLDIEGVTGWFTIGRAGIERWLR